MERGSDGGDDASRRVGTAPGACETARVSRVTGQERSSASACFAFWTQSEGYDGFSPVLGECWWVAALLAAPGGRAAWVGFSTAGKAERLPAAAWFKGKMKEDKMSNENNAWNWNLVQVI